MRALFRPFSAPFLSLPPSFPLHNASCFPYPPPTLSCLLRRSSPSPPYFLLLPFVRPIAFAHVSGVELSLSLSPADHAAAAVPSFFSETKGGRGGNPLLLELSAHFIPLLLPPPHTSSGDRGVSLEGGWGMGGKRRRRSIHTGKEGLGLNDFSPLARLLLLPSSSPSPVKVPARRWDLLRLTAEAPRLLLHSTLRG